MLAEVPPPGLVAHGFLSALWAGSIGLVALLSLRRSAADRRKTLRAVMALMSVVVLALLVDLHHHRVEVTDGRIRVQAGFFYSQDRPITDFDLDAARTGAQREIPQARLSLRVNGSGMPGYAAGHFQLHRAGRVFVLLTQRESVLFLPALTGPALLLGVRDPQALLAALRDG